MTEGFLFFRYVKDIHISDTIIPSVLLFFDGLGVALVLFVSLLWSFMLRRSTNTPESGSALFEFRKSSSTPNIK